MNDLGIKLLLSVIIMELGWTMIVTTRPMAILMGIIFVITGALTLVLLVVTRQKA